MKKTLLLSLLLALGAAAIAQTAPQAIAGGQAEMCSGGPVVADWGHKLGQVANTTEGNIFKEVRHELLLLPYYSLFDDLEYCVQGRTVVLSGTVTSDHSVTKEDAQAAVKRIEGVEQVTNNIRILSPNPLDQRAREQVYRKLVNTGGLSQYFWEAAPSIHIIVDNLHLTLKGYVNSEGDKNLAGITANQVSSLFSVTNQLQVVK
jgi:hyperosmotically inducible periplasmic protein